jgi:hypothetical protein
VCAVSRPDLAEEVTEIGFCLMGFIFNLPSKNST